MPPFAISLTKVEGSEAFVHYIKRLLASVAQSNATQWRISVQQRARFDGDEIFEVILRWQHCDRRETARGEDTDMYLAVRNAFATARDALLRPQHTVSARACP